MIKNLYKILYILIILLSINSVAHTEENLKNEAESLANAWLIGASLIPFAETEAGIQKNNGIDTEIYWKGRGFSAESMYITGLYETDFTINLFFSLNTSLEFIEWNEQSFFQEEIGEIENFKKNKGYSILLTQKLRINLMGWNTIGTYVEGDAGVLYSHPENLEADEKMNKGFDPTLGGGFGAFIRFPGYNSMFLDFEMNAVLFKSENPDIVTNYISEIKISAVYEIF